MLRQRGYLGVREACVGLPNVYELLISPDRERHVGEDAASLAVSVLRRGHDAIERGQRLLVLEPRLSPPTGRVNRLRVLDHQSFIRAGAGSVEKLIDVPGVPSFTLICEANGESVSAVL